jgi:hypothetical protein
LGANGSNGSNTDNTTNGPNIHRTGSVNIGVAYTGVTVSEGLADSGKTLTAADHTGAVDIGVAYNGVTVSEGLADSSDASGTDNTSSTVNASGTYIDSTDTVDISTDSGRRTSNSGAITSYVCAFGTNVLFCANVLADSVFLDDGSGHNGDFANNVN